MTFCCLHCLFGKQTHVLMIPQQYLRKRVSGDLVSQLSRVCLEVVQVRFGIAFHGGLIGEIRCVLLCLLCFGAF